MLSMHPLPWRACQMCRHGITVGAERCCTCPACTGSSTAKPVSVELLRRNAGPCGPEAHHLDFPGLHELPAHLRLAA